MDGFIRAVPVVQWQRHGAQTSDSVGSNPTGGTHSDISFWRPNRMPLVLATASDAAQVIDQGHRQTPFVLVTRPRFCAGSFPRCELFVPSILNRQRRAGSRSRTTVRATSVLLPCGTFLQGGRCIRCISRCGDTFRSSRGRPSGGNPFAQRDRRVTSRRWVGRGAVAAGGVRPATRPGAPRGGLGGRRITMRGRPRRCRRAGRSRAGNRGSGRSGWPPTARR